eukprot:8068079-Pyramimonas_sp.AAC.1
MILESRGPGGWGRPATACPRTNQWSREAEGPLGGKFVLLNQKCGRGGKCSLGESDVAGYVHVDDGLVMTAGPPSNQPQCDELMRQVADGWEAKGFLVTERVEAEDDLKAVGYRAQ